MIRWQRPEPKPRTPGFWSESLQFGGTLSKPATVTIGGNPACVDANNHYSGFANVTTGVNNILIVAKDFSGDITTNNIQVTVLTANAGGAPSYDILGNMTNNGAGQTYEWDGKNELTAINYATPTQQKLGGKIIGTCWIQ